MRKKINIVVAKAYPKIHKRAGQPTDFAKKIVNNTKLHTIRGNYDLWRVNADKMQSGNYLLSVSQWSSTPRQSKQREIFNTDERIGVERITIAYSVATDTIEVSVEQQALSQSEIVTLAANEGLSLDDFIDWFFAKARHESDKTFSGVIVHFTPLRYAHTRAHQ